MKTYFAVMFFLSLAICFVSELEIINGRNATEGEVPFQVSLHDSSFGHFCGGSIINEFWIITAGHCVVNKIFKATKIVYNTLDQLIGDEVLVKKTILYPKYQGLTTKRWINNDIALIQTAQPMKLNQRNPKPVKLPKQNEDPKPGSIAMISGWGVTATTRNPRFLQIVSVPVVNRTQCRKDYRQFVDKDLVTQTMICAGLEKQGGKSSCQGDSGGPLTLDGVLVGIVSWAKGCAEPHYPGVYTRVGYFRDWIANITGI